MSPAGDVGMKPSPSVCLSTYSYGINTPQSTGFWSCFNCLFVFFFFQIASRAPRAVRQQMKLIRRLRFDAGCCSSLVQTGSVFLIGVHLNSTQFTTRLRQRKDTAEYVERGRRAWCPFKCSCFFICYRCLFSERIQTFYLSRHIKKQQKR